jgi:hypothetical protein
VHALSVVEHDEPYAVFRLLPLFLCSSPTYYRTEVVCSCLLFQIMSSALTQTACRRIPSCIVLWNRSTIHRYAATASIDEQRAQSNMSDAQQNKSKAVPMRTSTSFVMNLFRGQFYPNEIFPYPNVLNDEQKDNVKMLIDPIWKFFEEKNDPAKNDQLETVEFTCLVYMSCSLSSRFLTKS